MDKFQWVPEDILIQEDQAALLSSGIFYVIYSSKEVKLGILDNSGDLISKNIKLKQIYTTLLNIGVYFYDISKDTVLYTKVTKQDGDVFAEAIAYHLNLLGFTIKKEIEEK